MLRGQGSATCDTRDVMTQIRDRGQLDSALSASAFLLFKHSLVCPTSERAFREYEAFVAAHPDVATAWIDVIGQRPLSLHVAAETGVRHESPQALWIVDGAVVWHASHWDITADNLAAATD